MTDKPVVQDAWQSLRTHTPARIALGRAGVSVTTDVHLQFQLDHARARDAVHQALDVPALAAQLQANGIDSLRVHSQAADRREYLQRPDLGRRLREADWQMLHEHARAEHTQSGGDKPEIALVIADGLSARAVMEQVPRFLPVLLQALQRRVQVCIAEQARVALGDDIGEALGASLAIVLIGERPGLSAADSLGLYLTWQPRRGGVDSQRNCISNIRPAGLDDENAARTCQWLVDAAFRLGYSGVELKDDTQLLQAAGSNGIPFLR